jgi:predicted permease
MPIYAIIIAVVFLYFEWDVPGFVENTTFLLTYSTIFLVLMSLGIALSRLKVVSWTHASILGAVRVIIGPLIGFTLIKFFNLDGFEAGVLLIQSCMPSAVLTYLVGSMYSEKKVVDSVASVIVTSTIMSFVTVPIVVFASLKYFQ